MISPSLLTKFPVFCGLTDEQTESIIPLLVQEEFQDGDIIIEECKSNDRIFFIMKGRVAVTKREKLMTYLDDGDFFGEMEILDVMAADASIKAISPVTAFTMSNKALRAIYYIDVKTFSLIVMNLARDLSRRVRKMNEKLSLSEIPILF